MAVGLLLRHLKPSPVFMSFVDLGRCCSYPYVAVPLLAVSVYRTREYK